MSKTNKTKYRGTVAASIMGTKKWEAVPRRLLQTVELDSKSKAAWMYLLSRYDLSEVSLKDIAGALGLKNKKSAREAVSQLRDANMLTTSINESGYERVDTLTVLADWKYGATPFPISSEGKVSQDVDAVETLSLDTKLGKLTSDRTGWFPVPNSIWSSGLSLAEIMVWSALMCTSDWWYPGYREIGHYAGICENKKIDATIRSLESKGILSVRWGETGMHNKYRFTTLQEWKIEGSPNMPGRSPITPARPPIMPDLETLSRYSSLDTQRDLRGEVSVQEDSLVDSIPHNSTPEKREPSSKMEEIMALWKRTKAKQSSPHATPEEVDVAETFSNLPDISPDEL